MIAYSSCQNDHVGKMSITARDLDMLYIDVMNHNPFLSVPDLSFLLLSSMLVINETAS